MTSLDSVSVFHLSGPLLHLQRHGAFLLVGSLSFGGEMMAVNRHSWPMSRPIGRLVSMSCGETECPATTSLLLSHISQDSLVARSLTTWQPFTWLIFSQSTLNMLFLFPFFVVPRGTRMLQAVNTNTLEGGGVGVGGQLVYWASRAAPSPPLDPCSHQSPTLCQFVFNLYFSSWTPVEHHYTVDHWKKKKKKNSDLKNTAYLAICLQLPSTKC